MRFVPSFFLLLVLPLAAAPQDLEIAPRESIRFEGFPRWFASFPDNPAGLYRLDGFAGAALDWDRDGDVDWVGVREFAKLDLLENRGGYLVLADRRDLTGWAVSPFAAVAGDFNGDGLVDVAIAGFLASTQPTGTLRFLFAEPTGGFRASPQITIPPLYPVLRAADVDGDRRDEAIVAGGTQTVGAQHLVAIVSADGTVRTVDLGFEAVGLDVGDLTGDGRPDLATTRWQGMGTDSTVLQVRFNDGLGNFPGPGIDLGSSRASTYTRILDGDNDGDQDVLAFDMKTPGTDLHLFVNDGTGQFSGPVISALFGEDWVFDDVESADVDGDGVRDLVLSSRIAFFGADRSLVTTAEPDGAGGFMVIDSISVEMRDIEIVDLTGRGQLSVIGGEGQIIPLERDGSFGGTVLPRPGRPPVGSLPLIFDANLDGRQDVALFDPPLNGVEIYFSDGERGFAPFQFHPAGFPVPSSRPVVADVNGDPWPDLLLVAASDVVAMINDGTGAFPTTVHTPMSFSCFCAAWRFSTADFNGDGLTDVLAHDKRNAEALLMVAVGDGTFLSASLSLPDVPGDSVAEDLNGDGFADFAYVTRAFSQKTLIIHEGRGDGTFMAHRSQVLPDRLWGELAAGDLDADGDMDLVASLTHGFVVLSNDGQGSFSIIQRLEKPVGNLDDLRLVDLDGDGDLDVAGQLNHTRRALRTFLNNGRGRFRFVEPGWEVGSNGGNRPFWFDFGDLDADGIEDLLITAQPVDPIAPDTRVYFNHSRLRADGLAAPGRTVHLDLRMAEASDRPYQLLASFLGTFPGQQIGGTLFPLNSDPLLFNLIQGGGAGIFVGFSGTMGKNGRAHAELRIPSPLPFPGPIPIDFAFFSLSRQGGVLTSNALSLEVQ